MTIKTVRLDPDARAILERARATGNLLVLPEGHLERDLYERIDRILVAAGGKWSRRARAHVFASGRADEALRAILADGSVVDKKRTLGQFYTPAELADRLVAAAGIGSGDAVLEPSAGGGALIDAVLRLGHDLQDVLAVELDPTTADELRRRFAHIYDDRGNVTVSVRDGDFLGLEPPVRLGDRAERVVMNPPFADGAALRHLVHALRFLSCRGVLAAVMPAGWCQGSRRSGRAFEEEVEPYTHRIEELEVADGSFAAAGTGVSTVIVRVEAPSDPRDRADLADRARAWLEAYGRR
jgi:hypothetical protein